MVGTFPGVEFGPLHYRALESDKADALKSAGGNFDHKMTLSAGSLADLQWWITAFLTAVRHINHGSPDLTLTTDVSNKGWGATSGDHKTLGLSASRETRECHINILELRPVELGLVSYFALSLIST